MSISPPPQLTCCGGWPASTDRSCSTSPAAAATDRHRCAIPTVSSRPAEHPAGRTARARAGPAGPVLDVGVEYEYWKRTHLTVDVVPGRGSGFSSRSPGGRSFPDQVPAAHRRGAGPLRVAGLIPHYHHQTKHPRGADMSVSSSSLGDRLEQLLQVDRFRRRPRSAPRPRYETRPSTIVRRPTRRPAGRRRRGSGCTGTRRSPQCSTTSNPPFYTWFADGTINVSYNCLDRHVLAGKANRVAF